MTDACANISPVKGTRQFESFMRLSAMLTHDLKNSITSLSMLAVTWSVNFTARVSRRRRLVAA